MTLSIRSSCAGTLALLLLCIEAIRIAYKRWLTARIFPSLSLNQAVFAPPATAMLFCIFTPGMSYSSNTTPRALSSVTSSSTSSTCQNAWLAQEVPPFGVGYRKHAVPLPNS